VEEWHEEHEYADKGQEAPDEQCEIEAREKGNEYDEK
jgi:hypothetical protein